MFDYNDTTLRLSESFFMPETYLVPCGRCDRPSPAYYTLSHLTKGLWVKCSRCGLHARKYIPDLPIPSKPSKAYLIHVAKQLGESLQIDN